MNNGADIVRRIGVIRPPHGANPEDVQRHLDSLTKPPGSLGVLERVAVRLARIYGDPPPKLERRAVFVLAADHGVARHVGAGLVTARDAPLDLVGLGDMGIGNTTSASALIAGLTGVPVAQVVGPGTGLTSEGVARKSLIIENALARLTNSTDPIELFCHVGGLEIAGLVGVVLGAAVLGWAIVLDGFITTAAALFAVRLAPAAREYLFASHLSTEPGHRVALQALDLEPLLQLGLRLGEGTGAALAMPILDASGSLLREIATFASAGVSGAT